MNLDLVTKLIFNERTIVEVSSDYEDSVTISVSYDDDDTEFDHRSCVLEPDEIDLFISTLNLYKNRIINGRKEKPPL